MTREQDEELRVCVRNIDKLVEDFARTSEKIKKARERIDHSVENLNHIKELATSLMRKRKISDLYPDDVDNNNVLRPVNAEHINENIFMQENTANNGQFNFIPPAQKFEQANEIHAMLRSPKPSCTKSGESSRLLSLDTLSPIARRDSTQSEGNATFTNVGNPGSLNAAALSSMTRANSEVHLPRQIRRKLNLRVLDGKRETFNFLDAVHKEMCSAIAEPSNKNQARCTANRSFPTLPSSTTSSAAIPGGSNLPQSARVFLEEDQTERNPFLPAAEGSASRPHTVEPHEPIVSTTSIRYPRDRSLNLGRAYSLDGLNVFPSERELRWEKNDSGDEEFKSKFREPNGTLEKLLDRLSPYVPGFITERYLQEVVSRTCVQNSENEEPIRVGSHVEDKFFVDPIGHASTSRAQDLSKLNRHVDAINFPQLADDAPILSHTVSSPSGFTSNSSISGKSLSYFSSPNMSERPLSPFSPINSTTPEMSLSPLPSNSVMSEQTSSPVFSISTMSERSFSSTDSLLPVERSYSPAAGLAEKESYGRGPGASRSTHLSINAFSRNPFEPFRAQSPILQRAYKVRSPVDHLQTTANAVTEPSFRKRAVNNRVTRSRLTTLTDKPLTADGTFMVARDPQFTASTSTTQIMPFYTPTVFDDPMSKRLRIAPASKLSKNSFTPRPHAAHTQATGYAAYPYASGSLNRDSEYSSFRAQPNTRMTTKQPLTERNGDPLAPFEAEFPFNKKADGNYMFAGQPLPSLTATHAQPGTSRSTKPRITIRRVDPLAPFGTKSSFINRCDSYVSLADGPQFPTSTATRAQPGTSRSPIPWPAVPNEEPLFPFRTESPFIKRTGNTFVPFDDDPQFPTSTTTRTQPGTSGMANPWNAANIENPYVPFRTENLLNKRHGNAMPFDGDPRFSRPTSTVTRSLTPMYQMIDFDPWVNEQKRRCEAFAEKERLWNEYRTKRRNQIAEAKQNYTVPRNIKSEAGFHSDVERRRYTHTGGRHVVIERQGLFFPDPPNPENEQNFEAVIRGPNMEFNYEPLYCWGERRNPDIVTIEDTDSETESNDDTEDEEGHRRCKKIKLEPDANEYDYLPPIQGTHLIANEEAFECPICFEEIKEMEGVVLRQCLHKFCKQCLAGVVEYSESPEVKCPYQDNEYSCTNVLQEREIRCLVKPHIYERHLKRSVDMAENQAANSFHCKTADCTGWCLYDDDVPFFPCPVCRRINCLMCSAIHEGLDCRQYQDNIEFFAGENEDQQKTKEYLLEMVARGEAMHCPRCNIILTKKIGCDWCRCTLCMTEVCWVTKGPRWGPNGNGDISGGCHCRENGRMCHPSCTGCH